MVPKTAVVVANKDKAAIVHESDTDQSVRMVEEENTVSDSMALIKE